MVKTLIGVIIFALLCVVGYYRFSSEPLDPRQTLEAGIKQVKAKTALAPEQETLLRVQLAISDYMAEHGSAPATLADLVPKYFDQEPKNPVTGEPFPYTREGKMPRLGAQTTQLASAKTPKDKGGKEGEVKAFENSDFVNPNTMKVDEFVYDKTGKRDPFEPFDLSATPEPVQGSSLVAYTLGQLRLTAVLKAPSGENKGIVEDSQGRGYTVNVGTRIGSEGGVVVAIEPDRLKIVNTTVDFTGAETQTAVEMKINQAGPSGAKQPPKATDKKKK